MDNDNKELVPPIHVISCSSSENCQKGKLLVLDIDETLCNYKYRSVRGSKQAVKSPLAPRPHLHKFLEEVQEHYDVVLWSATTTQAIISKMNSMEITNEKFKINFVIDYKSMVPVQLASGKVTLVKPLSVIWKQYKQYNETNTIIVDDKVLNFHLNPKNGLPIPPYHQYMHAVDKDLLEVSKYLVKLAQNCNDFSTVNHADYKSYNPLA